MNIIKVAGENALIELDRYRNEFGKSKLFPFLIGSDEELERLHGMLNPPTDGGAEYLEQADTVDVSDWIAERAPKIPKSWPKTPAPPLETILSLYDPLSNERKPEVNIGLVETENSWEVFARLGYGDWNECPPPYIHVALHKYWSSKYKTSPVVISSDVVECYVTTPPSERACALSLAREHYGYCYDVVDQGLGTVGKLASSLLGARFWYFWWD